MTGGLPRPSDEPVGRYSWPWIVGAFLFVVVSPIAAAMTRSSQGTAFTTWLVVQIAATALAWLIPEARQVLAGRKQATAEENEFEARVDTALRMNDALDPIISLLGNLAAEADPVLREQLRAQAVPLVIKTAADLIGPDRTRACWFRLDAGRHKRLVPVSSAGRAGSPSTTFEEGSPAGDAAIGLVLADRDRLCEDIETEPPPGWDASKPRDYRTFISVSVIASDIAYGMLTLDALEPGDLTHDDMRLLRLMAGALAVALTIP
jgi:GAF domain-containing protein